MRPAARCRVEHHVLPDRDSLDAAGSLLFRNGSGDRGTDGDPLPARWAGGHDICRRPAQCDAVTTDETTTTAGRAAAPAAAATRARRGAGGTMTPSFQHPPPLSCMCFFLLVTPTGIGDDGSVRLVLVPRDLIDEGWVLDHGDLRRLQLLTTTTTRDRRRDVCRRPPGRHLEPHGTSIRHISKPVGAHLGRRDGLSAGLHPSSPSWYGRHAAIRAHNSAGIIADARSGARGSRNGVVEIHRGAAQPQMVHICLRRSFSVSGSSGFRWCWLGKFCVDPFSRTTSSVNY